MCRRVIRRSPYGFLKRVDGATGVAHLRERGAEFVTQRGIIRGRVESSSKVFRRGLEVAVLQRPHAAVFLRSGAAQQAANLRHQRIGRTNLDGASLSEVR